MSILELSDLHSMQIGLLGYIQIEGQAWYIEQKLKNNFAPDEPFPAIHNQQLLALNHLKTWMYVLTTNANKAIRV